MTTRIWTSEPQAARALAAEFRHAPEVTAQFFSTLLATDLNGPPAVRLEEGASRVDVVLRFENASIGIEAKLGHEITLDQIDRQSAACDHQVLLVLDHDDVGQDIPERVVRTTWQDVLRSFPDSRLRPTDIDDLAERTAPVRMVRRTLRGIAVRLQSFTETGWEVEYEPNNSGFPALTICSPAFDEMGHCILAQVEPPRNSGPATPVSFAATVGITVADGDLDLAQRSPPAWVRAMRLLSQRQDAMLEQLSIKVGLTRAHRFDRHGSRPAALLAERWDLPLHFAKGYQDSYLGVRFEKAPAAALESYAHDVLAFMRRFDRALRGV